MKKKIGEIYNKPIVVGNKNEINKNEIHVDELQGGEKRNIKYCRIAEEARAYVVYASEVKVNGGIQQPCGVFMSEDDPASILIKVEEAKFDPDVFAIYNAEEKITVNEMLKGFINAGLFTEITEEEFYNLDNGGGE